MNVTEVLQIVDQLVFEHTGNHLNDVQRAVIRGSWEGKTYNEIGENNHFNKSHASDVGGDLWKLLSEILGEEIKKSNFRSTIERLQLILSPITIQKDNKQNNNNNNFYFGLQPSNQSNKNQEKDTDTKSQSIYYDLTFAPQIIKFYNRETELKTISNWIFNQNIRLISVLGLSGIGKSYLVKKFIDLNLEKFEVIIWRSLKYPESLDALIDDIFNICKIEIKTNTNNKLKQLFEILTNKKCLIILDDMQNIFISGQFAGKYQAESQDYQNFFTRIIETEHQSNLILISQEKCSEMASLDEELYPVKCLELSGLDSSEILHNVGLKDEDSWLNLINLYEGNPFYLTTIANSIKTVFDGNVSEFLAENHSNTGILPVITTRIEANLQLLFNRLSPIEQQIVITLSNSEQFLSREDFKTSLDLSSTDLINSLQSLQQRYLVRKVKEDKILFKLSSVFREYVKTFCKN